MQVHAIKCEGAYRKCNIVATNGDCGMALISWKSQHQMMRQSCWGQRLSKYECMAIIDIVIIHENSHVEQQE